MTRRLFYVALGATAGVLVVRRLSQAADRLTPGGMAHSLASAVAGLGDAIRDFGTEVRLGMAEREAELVDALGLDDPGSPQYVDEPQGSPS